MENATVRYMDQLKAACGLSSDYALAAALGVSRQAISKYRAGRDTFGNRPAFRCAELLGIDPAEVIAAVELDRARSEKERAFWLRAAGAAASILLGVLVGSQPAPANASQRVQRLDRLYILPRLALKG